MLVATEFPTKRNVGMLGRVELKPHLLDVANHYDFEIRKAGDGDYELFSKKAAAHPRKALPRSIQAKDVTSRGLVFDLNGLQDALEFLHHPVRMTTRHAAALEHEERVHKAFADARALEEMGVASLNHAWLEVQAIKKDINAHEKRVQMHSFLRFATTGSVSVPVVKGEFADIDACHADEENKMRDNDAWAMNYEMAHINHGILFDQENPPEDKIKMIPGLHYNPAQGIVIDIHPSLLNDGALLGDNQKLLKSNILTALKKAGVDDKALYGDESTIYGASKVSLSPDQFEQFCTNLYAIEEPETLISAIRAEHDQQKSAVNMEEKQSDLRDSDLYQDLAAEQEKTQAEIRSSFEDMLLITTQLTPIISGPHLALMWKRMFPSRSDDMPFDDVVQDYANMVCQIRSCLGKNELTKEDLESFAQEYHTTLAFTGKMAEILGEAAEERNDKSIMQHVKAIGGSAAAAAAYSMFWDTGSPSINMINILAYALAARSTVRSVGAVKDAVAGLSTEQEVLHTAISTKMKTIGDTIQNTSISGVHVEDEYLEDHHQETLSVLRKSLGQDGTFAEQALEAGKEGAGEFIEDIVGSLKESKITQAGFVGVSGYLVWNTLYGDSSSAAGIAGNILNGSAAEQSADSMSGYSEDMMELLNPSAEEFENLATPPDIAFSCHTDLKLTPEGAWQAYKHCLFGTIVEDQAANIISGIDFVAQEKIMGSMPAEFVNAYLQETWNVSVPGNDKSTFVESAKEIVKPTSKILMWINFLQNITHGGLWAYSGHKGWSVGFDGYKEAFSFLNPIRDIAQRAVLAPFRVVSAAFEVAGVKIPLLPERHLSAQENLYKFLEPGEDLVRSMNFKTADLDKGAEISSVLYETARLRQDIIMEWPDGIKPADLNMKVGGFKTQFQISSQNLKPVMRAIQKLDHVMSSFADKIGVEAKIEPWHHNMITIHMNGVSDALQAYLRDGDSEKLKEEIGEHLDYLAGFELRQTGKNSILDAMLGEEADERVQSVLLREANMAYGHQKRLTHRAFHAMRLTGQEVRKDGARTTVGDLIKSAVALPANQMWDGIISATDHAQRGYQYVANRPAISKSLMTAAVTLIAADMAGVAPDTPLVQMPLDVLGSAFGIASTLSSFVVFNSGEDLILVHSVMMALLITGGAAAAIGHNKALSPAALSIAEGLREKWEKVDAFTAKEKLDDILAEVQKYRDEKREESADKVVAYQEKLNDIISVPQTQYCEDYYQEPA